MDDQLIEDEDLERARIKLVVACSRIWIRNARRRFRVERKLREILSWINPKNDQPTSEP
jgi:hypothetical protein